MSKNLNVKTEGSWCYDNKPENCEKYGRLYTWAAAMNFSSSCNEVRCQDLVEYPHQGICPSGFHIPSWTDFPRHDDSLLQELVAGTKLKSSSGWGGMARWKGFDFDYDFRGAGEVASFWTVDEDHSGDRYYKAENMYLEKDYETHGNVYKYNGFSVRCILD